MDFKSLGQIKLHSLILWKCYASYPVVNPLLPPACIINKSNQIHGLHSKMILVNPAQPVRARIAHPAFLHGKKPVLRVEQETIVLWVSNDIQSALKSVIRPSDRQKEIGLFLGWDEDTLAEGVIARDDAVFHGAVLNLDDKHQHSMECIERQVLTICEEFLDHISCDARQQAVAQSRVDFQMEPLFIFPPSDIYTYFLG